MTGCSLICVKERLHVTRLLLLTVCPMLYDKCLNSVTFCSASFTYRSSCGGEGAVWGTASPDFLQVSIRHPSLGQHHVCVLCHTHPGKPCKENKVCSKREFNVLSDLTASFKRKRLSWAKGTFASPNKWNYGSKIWLNPEALALCSK